MTTREHGDLRRYFSQIPNLIVDDKRVCPMGLALYCYYKRVAGEHGTAWKAKQTVVSETNISHGKFHACRKRLATLGYISVTEKPGHPSEVTITNIWDQNMLAYSSGTPAIDWGVHHTDGGVHDVDGGRPPGGPKEDPSEEEPLKKTRSEKSAHARKTVLDEEYQEALIEEFSPLLGSREAVTEEIASAQGHKSWEKWNDKRLYVRNWLKRSAKTPAPKGQSEREWEYGHLLGRTP